MTAQHEDDLSKAKTAESYPDDELRFTIDWYDDERNGDLRLAMWLKELRRRREQTVKVALSDDYFDSLFSKAKIEASISMIKHPQPNYVLLKLAEEAGEVVKAGVHAAEGRGDWIEVESEIVQLIAMAIRLLAEGDETIGLKPKQ